jgi:hypothetical protein
MKDSDLYQTYSDILQKLTTLQFEYEETTAKDQNVEKRQSLIHQIKVYQDKLLSVTDKLIYCNPFQRGLRVKHGPLKESTV